MNRVNPRMWSHMQNKEALGKIMETYAKNANKRLRSLERAGLEKSSNAYRAIESFHEGNLEFMTTGRSGKINFKRGYKDRDIEEIKREIGQLDKFLFGVNTSTVRGTKEHYKKIKKALEITEKMSTEFNERFKKMSMNEFSDFWRIKNISKLIEMYGSEIIITIIDYSKSGIPMEAIENLVSDLVNKELTDRQVNKIFKDFEDKYYNLNLKSSDEFNYDDFMSRN